MKWVFPGRALLLERKHAEEMKKAGDDATYRFCAIHQFNHFKEIDKVVSPALCRALRILCKGEALDLSDSAREKFVQSASENADYIFRQAQKAYEVEEAEEAAQQLRRDLKPHQCAIVASRLSPRRRKQSVSQMTEAK